VSYPLVRRRGRVAAPRRSTKRRGAKMMVGRGALATAGPGGRAAGRPGPLRGCASGSGVGWERDSVVNPIAPAVGR
jgi:hypothetical protein